MEKAGGRVGGTFMCSARGTEHDSREWEGRDLAVRIRERPLVLNSTEIGCARKKLLFLVYF